MYMDVDDIFEYNIRIRSMFVTRINRACGRVWVVGFPWYFFDTLCDRIRGVRVRTRLAQGSYFDRCCHGVSVMCICKDNAPYNTSSP